METTVHEVLSRHSQFALGGGRGTVGALAHITLSGQPSDGETISIGDGDRFRTFEFDNDSTVSSTTTNATGNVDLTSQPNDGDTVTLDDGTNPPVVYEFDNDASVTETATLQQVVIGASAAATIAAFIAKVTTPTAGAVIGMTAAAGAGDSADLTNNLSAGVRGNIALAESTGGARIAVTGMSGGTDVSIAVEIGPDVRTTLVNLMNEIHRSLTTRAFLAPSGNDRLVLRNRDDLGDTGNAEIVEAATNLTAVGFASGGRKPIGILKVTGRPAPQILRGRIRNLGAQSVTVSVDFSANNNSIGEDGSQVPSAYADQSIRVNGTAVANGQVTVVPRGVEEFLVELAANVTVPRYFKFDVTPFGLGDLTLEQEAGGHIPLMREGTP